MENLYNPHRDPIVLILLIALFISGGVAYALKSRMDTCMETHRTARGEVFTIPLASGLEQKITAHDGKVYIMIEAPTAPSKFVK